MRGSNLSGQLKKIKNGKLHLKRILINMQKGRILFATRQEIMHLEGENEGSPLLSITFISTFSLSVSPGDHSTTKAINGCSPTRRRIKSRLLSFSRRNRIDGCSPSRRGIESSVSLFVDDDPCPSSSTTNHIICVPPPRRRIISSVSLLLDDQSYHR